MRWTLFVGLAMLGHARAAAAEGPCSPIVDGEGELAERVRTALATHDDIDACARVGIDRRGRTIVVSVTLTDGRSASRTVTRTEDVVSTVEALLLVPKRPEPVAEVAPEPAPPPPPPVVFTLAPPVVERAERPALVPAQENARLRIELSAFSGARVVDSGAGASLGLLSFADVGGWLAGFGGRVDYMQDDPGGAPNGGLSLMLLGGHRWGFGATSLDIYAGPGVELQGNEAVMRRTTPAGTVIEKTSTGSIPRFYVGTRWSFRARSVFRLFVALDADAGGHGDDPAANSGSEAVHPWSVGLGLGATVGTL